MKTSVIVLEDADADQGQVPSPITAGPFAPTREQLREAAADLYDACKFVLDPTRSGYAIFSNRATLILEAAVAKAEGKKTLSERAELRAKATMTGNGSCLRLD